MGTAFEAVRGAKICINIDHHPSNPRYGDLVYIDSNAPATGQILFELLHAQDFPIDAAMAENLFVAISTDTGSFQYPNTTSRTFEIAAQLVDAALTSEGSANSSTKIIRAVASSFCASCCAHAFRSQRQSGQL